MTDKHLLFVTKSTGYELVERDWGTRVTADRELNHAANRAGESDPRLWVSACIRSASDGTTAATGGRWVV